MAACLADSSCHVYVAGNLFATPWSGLVPVCIFLVNFAHMMMGGFIGAARKKYGIPYPTLYAVPNTKADYSPKTEATGLAEPVKETEVKLVTDAEAYAFNCVQRGHQNFIENLPAFLAMLLINWFTFPLIAGWLGIAWTLCKLLYFFGYSRSANSRLWGVGSYLPQFALYGLTIASAVFLFSKKQPY